MAHDLLSQHYESFHAERGKKGTASIPKRIDFLRNRIGTGKQVVELGCRYGDLLSNFNEGNTVVGVDIDRTALETCKARFGIETHLADLSSPLPLGNRAFDIVVLSEVLEHLPYPDITLSEIRRILKEEGVLLGSVPNGRKLRNRLRFLFGGPVDLDRTHLHHFSIDTLTRTLQTHFKSTEIIPVGARLPFLPKTLFSNYLLFSASQPISSQ
jgi:SAM-dependent methyltransferase